MNGKLTNVSSVYFQADGADPVRFDPKYTASVEGIAWVDANPPIRRAEIGEIPVKIASEGEAAFFIIRNLGTQRTKTPTKEDAAEDAAKVLILSFGGRDLGHGLVIPPKKHAEGIPHGEIWLRCRQGTVGVSIVLIPGKVV